MRVKIISEEGLAVDPQMMFKRMLIIVNNSDSKLKNGPLNTAAKAKFSGAIAKIYKDNPGNTIQGPECNVLDGESLLQLIPWTKGRHSEFENKYISIVLSYVKLM